MRFLPLLIRSNAPRSKVAGIGIIRSVVVLSLFFIVIGILFNLLISSRKLAHRNQVIGEMQTRGEKALDAIAGDLTDAVIALGSCPLSKILYKSTDPDDPKRTALNILTASPRDVVSVRSFVSDNVEAVSLWKDFAVTADQHLSFCNSDYLVNTKVVSVDGDAEKEALNNITVNEPLQFIRWGYATIAAKITPVRYEIAPYEGAPALMRITGDGAKKIVLAKEVTYLELKYFYIDGDTSLELKTDKELIGIEVALTVLPATKFDPLLNTNEFRQGIVVWRDIPYYKLNVVPHPYKMRNVSGGKEAVDSAKLEMIP